jgi:putative endopeptidase
MKVKLEDDFYNYVNGSWLENNEIPKTHDRYGTFEQLTTKTNKNILKIIEKSNNNIIKTLFNQGTSLKERNNVNNINIIYNIIDNINQITNITELLSLMVKYDINIPITFNVCPHITKATYNILNIDTSGFELINRDYYILKEHKHYIVKYRKFIKKYMKLFNIKLDIDSIINIETLFAKYTYSNVETRDPYNICNIFTFKNLIKKYKNLSFFASYLNLDSNKEINITNVKFIKFFDRLMDKLSLEEWKNYFIYKTIISFRRYLTIDIEKCYFNFFKKIFYGQKKINNIKERVCKHLCDNIGELIDKIYIKKHFNIESKNKVINMTRHMKNIFKNKIQNNDWMENKTKMEAIKKIDNMNMKIGYPNKYYKNYDNLIIDNNNSYLQNIMIIKNFNNKYKYKELYKKVNKEKWIFDSFIVNAFYEPQYNELIIPAGILQEPFFSLKYSDAKNFGGIGTVIAHEINHGFDDDCSNYDAYGRLNKWWTKNDFKEYNKRTNKIVKQYSDYKIGSKYVNGYLTLGENIADICGVTLAYDSLISKNNINKEFFFNYAKIWRILCSKELINNKLLNDPHAPNIFRVNCVLKNVDAFYKVFDIKENDKMFLAESKRVKIF